MIRDVNPEEKLLKKLDLVRSSVMVDDKSQDAENLDLLKQAIVCSDQWDVIFLLICRIKQPISDEYITFLAKHKDKIISAENLKIPAIDAEYLTASLTKSTNLGRLAHCQRGTRAPAMQRSFGFVYLSGALGRIKKAITQRQQKPGFHTDQKKLALVDRMAVLVAIDQLPRENAVLEDAQEFIHQLEKWVRKNNITQNNPVIKMLQIWELLADKGHPALAYKKENYGDSFIATKIHFRSPKVEGNTLGQYRNKHAVHIGKNQGAHVTEIFSTGIHEFVHHLCALISGGPILQSQEKWHKLAVEIFTNIKKIPDDKLPKAYKFFDFLTRYPKEQYANEMPSRLIEFYISTGSLPDDQRILPTALIIEIAALFNDFMDDAQKFKEKLAKAHSEQKFPGRAVVYEYLRNGRVDEFCKYVTPKNYRIYNLPPFHIADVSLFAELEERGFSLASDTNKFNQTALEVALENKSFTKVIEILRHYKTWQDFPDSLNFHPVLIHAINSKQDYQFIAQLLTCKNVHANKPDSNGITPLGHALKIPGLDYRIIAAIIKSIEQESGLCLEDLLAMQIVEQNPDYLRCYREVMAVPPAVSTMSFFSMPSSALPESILPAVVPQLQ